MTRILEPGITLLDNGSVRINRHRLSVRISRQVADTERRFKTRAFEPTVCWSPKCRKAAMYLVSERAARAELVIQTMFCGECGEQFEEPID